ncbi:MAG: N-acetylneuraminate synthase [Trueperaceae bacterium]|nr:N-acetylneuraminate synthase [Trueperaceae bacterium]
MTTLVIAEAGVNHNGDIGMAIELVARAADAGADIVKFQTFDTSQVVARNAPKAAYQVARTGDEDSQYDMVRRLELSHDAHLTLVEACRAHGITFMSTAFDHGSLDLLMAIGVERLKVPSGEITNLPLLRDVGRRGLPVILSTGMATLGEVETALDVLRTSGTATDRVTVLHCTTEYPAPFPDVNLRAMTTLRDALGVDIGYSDHTPGIEVPIAAVALGATIIEKHLTLDRSLPGPDHHASLEPGEFAQMVRSIRHVEVALGDGIKRVVGSEAQNRTIARRSIVAATPIRAGETFTSANLATKRPAIGLSPMRWDEVIGRTAARDFAPDEPIEL